MDDVVDLVEVLGHESCVLVAHDCGSIMDWGKHTGLEKLLLRLGRVPYMSVASSS